MCVCVSMLPCVRTCWYMYVPVCVLRACVCKCFLSLRLAANVVVPVCLQVFAIACIGYNCWHGCVCACVYVFALVHMHVYMFAWWHMRTCLRDCLLVIVFCWYVLVDAAVCACVWCTCVPLLVIVCVCLWMCACPWLFVVVCDWLHSFEDGCMYVHVMYLVVRGCIWLYLFLCFFPCDCTCLYVLMFACMCKYSPACDCMRGCVTVCSRNC